jgi:hypothetical protein
MLRTALRLAGPFGLVVMLSVNTGVFARPAGPLPDTAAKPLNEAAIAAEAAAIRSALALVAPNGPHMTAARQATLIALGQRMVLAGHLFFLRPQLLLLVDRAAATQIMAVTLVTPDGLWQILGTSHVSTGKPGRKEHYKTPVGVLLNNGAELGYRAQGTYNQNHIRGLGVKGMRVWDFGWRTTDDWRYAKSTIEIRVEMHATDPAILAHRIGRPDSEGCIRVSAALNKFLDRRGIIDADLRAFAVRDISYRALLPAHADPTPLAGDAVVVIDSSEPWLRPHPPAPPAVAMGD